MIRRLAITVCTLALPGMAFAATRTYELTGFDSVSVAAGIDADVTVGPAHGVTAETGAGNFDDLRISVAGNELRIDREPRSWLQQLFWWNRDGYRVRVVMPALRSLTASAGAEVTLTGPVVGDFSVTASSGSGVKATQVRAGNVKAATSSGADLDLAGSCLTLEASASSGSDLDAEDLQCENVTVRASSGSDLSVAASKRVAGNASSGADIKVRGRPAVVQVESSSGADVAVRN